MQSRGLSRSEAEVVAFENAIVAHLNSTHPDMPCDRCAHCGGAETLDETLLPIGVGARHAWLHSGWWTPWRERQRKAAAEALAVIGVVEPAP